MAGLVRKPNGVFNVNWWLDDRQFNRSTKTKDAKQAELIRGRVENTLYNVQNGFLAIPDGADVAEFIFNGGKLPAEAKPVSTKPLTLEELFNKYSASLTDGAKEENTLYTERIHQKHLLRLMGKDHLVSSIDRAVVQEYVKARLAEGRKPDTIKKELNTLRTAWHWTAKGESLVPQLRWAIKDLSFPRDHTKPQFQTFDQITTKIERGGLSSNQIDELWNALFLTSEEIAELLEYVGAHADSLTHALIAVAALTGARRSELMRSRIDDFDFKHRSITVREKKRTRGGSYRTVDMHSMLEPIMQAHFAKHFEGQFTFYNSDLSPLTRRQMTHHFRRAVRNHEKFKRMRGWHVLRHSFISVLCQKGVDQRIISLYVGHQTREMEERYRHLIPEKVDRPIDRLLP